MRCSKFIQRQNFSVSALNAMLACATQRAFIYHFQEMPLLILLLEP